MTCNIIKPKKERTVPKVKTKRLTKKQLENLKVNGKIWGNKYYYVKVIHGVIKYRKIHYKTETGKKLMTDDYATFNGLWKYAKIKED